MDTDIAALEEAIDQTDGDTSILHENKAKDVVAITRGNIIANEQQAFLTYTALLSGWLYRHDRNVNTVLTGPSAGGKSMTQDVATTVLPSQMLYSASDSSSQGVLDDDSWEQALAAPLDEWQKIPDNVTEILKGLSGGADDRYEYVRSVQDQNADSGRSGHKIVKEARPYSFLYAQHAMDHELSTRLVFLPIDDNVHIRDAIRKKEAGWQDISVQGYAQNYVYDTSERERALRKHILDVPTIEDDDGHVRGTQRAALPPWVDAATEPVFDMSRTESNRVFGQIYNLMRASAGVLNHEVRGTVTVERDDEPVEATLVHPQDVANVLATQKTLLATTHELSALKLELIDCLRAHSGVTSERNTDARGISVDRVRDWLDENSILPTPRKQKLHDILTELAEQFYVTKNENAGSNGAHLYAFNSMRLIGTPRVAALTNHLPEERIVESRTLHAEAGYDDIDLDNPFAGVTDPFRDQAFVDTVSEFASEFSEDPVERADKTAALASGDTSTDGDGTSTDNTSASTSDTGDTDDDDNMLLSAAMGGDTDGATDGHGETDTTAIGSPDGYLERKVYARLLANEGTELAPDDREEHLLDVVPTGSDPIEHDLSGTPFDADHDWWDAERKSDDWVQTDGQAAAKIEDAVQSLEVKGLVSYDPTQNGFRLQVHRSDT